MRFSHRALQSRDLVFLQTDWPTLFGSTFLQLVPPFPRSWRKGGLSPRVRTHSFSRSI